MDVRLIWHETLGKFFGSYPPSFANPLLTETGIATVQNKTFDSTNTINGAQGSIAYERLVTTRVLTAADSGKTFGLALATGFTVTLPALASGLKFNFVVEISPTTAYVIASAEGDNMSGVGAAADGLAVTVQAGFVADSMNFVANLSKIGDKGEIVSVGTAGWAASAIVVVGGAVSFPG